MENLSFTRWLWVCVSGRNVSDFGSSVKRCDTLSGMKMRLCVIGFVLVMIALIPVWIFRFGSSRIYGSTQAVQPTNVAIVFGAGLTVQQTPSDALHDRLNVAAELFHQQKIKTILVSGDNRFENYNEPEVMKQTLIKEFLIPPEAIFADYAGRRTYDTCIRAKQIWGVDSAILVSQGYHLPRAIWTCEQVGIKSTGISASLQPYILGWKFKIRELGALYKAFIDVYVFHPDYIGGESIMELRSRK